MYLTELNEMIQGGENDKVEFKRKFSSPVKIAKEMIAFANSKGGTILFGIDDDKKVIGVESEKGELELINTAAKFNCEPEIFFTADIMLLKHKDIVVVNIEESKKKPHRLIEDDDSNDLKVYVRFNDKSILASKETVKILRNSNLDSPPAKVTIGQIEKSLFEYLDLNEKITVKGFKKLVNISDRRASRTLVNLVKANVIRHHYHGNEEFFTLI
jgi:predicted HTH transcriptional regulator